MKPEFQPLITVVTKASPVLGAVDRMTGRVKKINKQIENPNLGEEKAMQVGVFAGIIVGATVVASAVSCVFSKEPQPVPKELITVEADVCDTYELSAKDAFRRALGGQAVLSDRKGVHMQDGRNSLQLGAAFDATTRLTTITLDGQFLGGTGQTSKMVSERFVNSEVELPRLENTGDPSQWKWLLSGLIEEPATHLDAMSLKGRVDGYNANGELVHFRRIGPTCEISADPHTFRPQNSQTAPVTLPATVDSVVSIVTQSIK